MPGVVPFSLWKASSTDDVTCKWWCEKTLKNISGKHVGQPAATSLIKDKPLWKI